MSLSGVSEPPTLSVCIVTYERPSYLRRCLEALNSLTDGVDEVVVVDASARAHETTVREVCPDVTYVWSPQLAGWMTRSRNEALRWVTGDIIAFLDDDVCVHDGWSSALRAAFAHPDLAAAGGRTLNGQPGEEVSEEPIGRYQPGGVLTGGFAARSDGPIEIDHGIGANMAFRRAVLADLGGFRDDYPGTALREDTDMFLRVKSIGGKALFLPNAVVDHLPAPHVVGERFDTRYKLYARRNHAVLLSRHEGIRSPALRRWARSEIARVGEVASAKDRILRLGVTLLGLGWGAAALPTKARWAPMEPRRQDALGRELRATLGGGR